MSSKYGFAYSDKLLLEMMREGLSMVNNNHTYQQAARKLKKKYHVSSDSVANYLSAVHQYLNKGVKRKPLEDSARLMRIATTLASEFAEDIDAKKVSPAVVENPVLLLQESHELLIKGLEQVIARYDGLQTENEELREQVKTLSERLNEDHVDSRVSKLAERFAVSIGL